MSHSSRVANDGSCRLLVVDDDEVDRARIRRALRRQGMHYDIEQATTVHEALECLKSRTFDCGLFDYRLPDGTALDLMEKLREQTSVSPAIVVLTGVDDESVALEALKLGAQDYITKDSLDGHGLSRAIRYAIERVRVSDLQRRLVHADRLISIGQLVAGVAHEINNPANYVLCNLELLHEQVDPLGILVSELQRLARESGPNPVAFELGKLLQAHDLEQVVQDHKEMLQASLYGIRQIRSIVGELKNFSRIEVDSLGPTDLDAVVRSACRIVSHELRYRGKLVLQLGQPPSIIADRGKLVQVFTNLLVNAAQAIEPGACEQNEVRVRTFTAGGMICVSVEDTGSGIPESTLPRIFEPFFTTKTRGQGTGLGLSLCQDIVRKHAGEMTVHSQLGVGTSVEVTFPIHTELRGSKPQQRRASMPHADHRLKVLLIDDEIMLCNVYQRILAPHHDVMLAHSGREGLDILRSNRRFDVVLCDLMMPELNGMQLYERLSAESPEITERFIFCTGGAVTDRMQHFLGRLSVPLLNKPVSGKELLDTISRVVKTTREPRMESCGAPL